MGHISRKGGIEQLSMTGRRSKRAATVTYVDSLNTWETSKNMSNNEVMNASRERDG